MSATTPGPLFVKLNLSNESGDQYTIQNEVHSVRGDFKDVYVYFGGYFGSYGPHMFAAAPELLEALERLSAQCTRLRLPGQTVTDAEKAALAAIEKATGKP